MSRRAFVTLVEGRAYAHWYKEHLFEAQRAFARRHGAPLVVLEGRVDAPTDVDHPHPSWDKLRLFSAGALARCERLCWLDADVFPMRGAPDPFAQADEGWVAVDNNTFQDVAQARSDHAWSWFLPPAQRPRVLLNTGVLVLDREQHADVLSTVWNTFGGRWDQGPLSFALSALRPGKVAHRTFNLVVLHVLARRGHGPLGLRALVASPSLVHFAGTSVAHSPVYVPYVRAADAGDVRAMRRLEARQLQTTLQWGLQRTLRATQVAARTTFPGASVWQRRQALRRALGRTRRLLLSPHRTVTSGFTCVDVGSADRVEEKFSSHASSPSVTAFEALACGEALDAVVLEHVLEALPPDERQTLLAEAARAIGPGGSLQVLIAGAVTDGPATVRAALDRREQLSVAQVKDAALSAGLHGAEVVERSGVLELLAERRRVPRDHVLLRWTR